MTEQTAPEGDEIHVCKPDATIYYCPTAGETESDCHGGFDVCCSRTDLHQRLLKCSWAHLRRDHRPHSWEPQPGMNPVYCEGLGAAEERQAQRRLALAFNAIGSVLRKHDRFVPLSVRREVAAAVLAAVDNDALPDVDPSAPHEYLSTGCLHGEHAYCQSMTGQQGEKRPAECKFCRARCTCSCHAEGAAL
ncbi:hypothetical protein OG369_42985 [Streptomyces sp. NBC_01221]|uniref:hypothetical protein n=1 Tax=Streptomyces sp. NBC_01221 TaxID=2903782 RepID=UPI0022509C60|nr:hypothetical protein [Streptomyces sp. NBC_01221]MCX4792544.1 hypothetical protein [Streptomyces sp. NBC_01221]